MEKPIGVQTKAIRKWLVYLACTESTYSGGVRYTQVAPHFNDSSAS